MYRSCSIISIQGIQYDFFNIGKSRDVVESMLNEKSAIPGSMTMTGSGIPRFLP